MQVKLSLSEIRAEIKHLEGALNVIKEGNNNSDEDAIQLATCVGFSLDYIKKHIQKIEKEINNGGVK